MTRMNPQERERQILDTAIAVARRTHILLANPTYIAVILGVSRELVTHYLGSADERLERIADYARTVGADEIVRQYKDYRSLMSTLNES